MYRAKNILSLIRAIIMRNLKSSQNYWLAVRNTEPISNKFGYDRGKPIDRYWIEDFLEKNREYISGSCLEITDNAYTLKYGNNVKTSDVLDINAQNKKATIHGDLRNLKNLIVNDTYDCILLTHVLGLIDDIDGAISECHRILKPGGVLLATSSCFSPTYDLNSNYWRFTPNGAKYLFGKIFKDGNLKVTSYGNVLTGQCFWVGMSQEDLTPEQLQYNDPRYPCVVAIRAVKDREEVQK